MSPGYPPPVWAKDGIRIPAAAADRKAAQEAERRQQHRQNRAHLQADQAPVRGAQPRLQTR